MGQNGQYLSAIIFSTVIPYKLNLNRKPGKKLVDTSWISYISLEITSIYIYPSENIVQIAGEDFYRNVN